MQRLLTKMYRAGTRSISTRDLTWAIGEDLGPTLGQGSIARAAFEHQVPVFIPGITDGAVGSQLWLFWQSHKDLSIDLFSDEQHLSDLVFEAKRAGALMLGGGISKHHTIWWNQFRDGLDLAVFITTAVEWDGSLSGARTREAISWGKVKPGAGHVTVEGDVDRPPPPHGGGGAREDPPLTPSRVPPSAGVPAGAEVKASTPNPPRSRRGPVAQLGRAGGS